MNAADKFELAMRQLPLVAILRGLTPAEAPWVGRTLVAAGYRLIEVPLNSPDPFESIAHLASAHPEALVGAGTVLSIGQVQAVHAAGGQLVVSPHFDAAVVHSAVSLGMVCLPGVLSPTEAFGALAAGAHGLKLFPAELIPPAAVKALRAVLPASTRLLPVGGISCANLASYRAAGASGFGIGSALYRPGDREDQVQRQALSFVEAWRDAAR